MRTESRKMRVQIPLAAMTALLAGNVACAPKQVIPLDIAPSDVTLFLNREELEQIPESLKLKASEHHTLFFKREGYVSQFVLLESTGEKGDEALSPEYVKLELQRTTTRRPNLSLEIEDE